MTRMAIELTRDELVTFLKDRDGDRCMFPGCARALDDPRDINTIDHIYPQVLAKAAGWTRAQIDDLSNLQLMHKTCNAIKGHQLPDKDGKFKVSVREPKVVKGPRPELCELCFSGRLLMLDETCPDCGIGPQPARWPGSLQRKPKECDHSTYHCWICVVDQPNLRVPAMQRIITGP